MQIDPEITGSLAPSGVAGEIPPSADGTHSYLWWFATTAAVLATATAVLLASCLAVILGLA
jgi:hypothetical protein